MIVTKLIRKQNPLGETPIEGIFFNPSKPRSKQMATRDKYGRFLPGSQPPRKSNKKRGKKKAKKRSAQVQSLVRFKSNPTAYPTATILTSNPPPRRRGKRKSKKTTYAMISNPTTYPRTPNKRRRQSNPNDAPVGLAAMIGPVIAGLVGYITPGLIWMVIGETGRTKMRGWFTTGNSDAKARFALSALATVALYLLSSKVAPLKKYRRPIMIGSALSLVKDGADSMLSTDASTSSGKLRMVFGLPTGAAALGTGLAAGQAATGATPSSYYDPSTGQVVQGTGANAGLQTAPTADQSLTNGNGNAQGLTAGTQDQDTLASAAGDDFSAALDQAGLSGLGQVSYPIPSEQGLGSFFVDRSLQNVPSKKKNAGYQGLGAFYVDRNLVFTEQGQRHAAQLGKWSY